MSEQNNTWNVRIQHKKDSAENWQSKNPVLLLNELIIVETEDGDYRLKIGDGIHTYSDLPFADQLLRDEVESKVSKEEGKALSSNDFTDDLKNKLDGISIMKGATADAGGTSGLVPPPAQGADSKFLRGDGAWAALSPSDIGAAPTEHKHSASDITSGGTIKGNVTVDGTFTPNAIVSNNVFDSEEKGLEIPIVFLPTFSNRDVGVASDVLTGDFLQAWLKFICQHYTYTSGALFIGTVAPNYTCTIQCYIYDTTNINEDGLPEYSSGILQFTKGNNTLTIFRTIEHNFSLGYLNAFGSSVSTRIQDIRYDLRTVAEIDIGDGASGFPFSYGSVVAKGNLGNTIGQSTSDNYYWGTDSQGHLWAGRQTNGATTPTWVRAAMMDGELGFTKIWAGNFSSGTIELPGAINYAALMVYGPPKQGEENVISIVPAGSGIYVYHGGESSSLGYNTGSSNGHLAITITKNTNNGSINGVFAMVKNKA